MNDSPTRSGLRIGAVLAIVGAVLVASTIIWGWGRFAYGAGVLLAVLGVTALITEAVRRRAVATVLASTAAVMLTGGAVVAVNGAPSEYEAWDDPGEDADVVDRRSVRVGDLYIADGAAWDVATGDVAWSIEFTDYAIPSAVSDELVVFATADATVAVDPTSGEQVWTAPVGGFGISHDGDVIVMATNDDDAVALGLADGEVRWKRPGAPTHECTNDRSRRTDRPATESTAVLIGPNDSPMSREWRVLDVATGEVTVTVANCDHKARFVGGILVEEGGDDLVGRSITDGTELWRTEIDRPWVWEGSGSTIVVPPSSRAADWAGVDLIDVETGESERVRPPAGVLDPDAGRIEVLEWQRQDDVWVLVPGEEGHTLWNPISDELVEVPDGVNVDDVWTLGGWSWLSLGGEIRDVTGHERPVCWAMAPDGELHGPVTGEGCQASNGLIETEDGVFPVE
ncbi:PQQ-binding-like beta-propeller repeat protein [Georgenia sp. Z1344]|uniref:outer membrane protein assembly factor BamB family protein n=1 Tax=Georgenia sp. Z1344 TaxID=3416706 RepID=UPI003CE97446